MKENHLAREHTPEAIEARLQNTSTHIYLGDFVLGAIDGTVTTFAIVAGVAGAELGGGVAVVLGLANVLADGFSMAASNYLKARADEHIVERFRKLEEQHIDEFPDGEREEIRQIFAQKGFEGETLNAAVEVITRDRKRWVDTMLREEFGLQIDPPSPVKAALVTFAAFVLAGLIPLLPLMILIGGAGGTRFGLSAVLTMFSFAAIGVVRGWLTARNVWYAAVETVFVGGGAAALAYVAGKLLRDWVGA